MTSPAQITGQEYLMRNWLQHEADRLARLIHWSIHTPAEARHELRALARTHAARARLSLNPDHIADRMLAEEWHRQDANHAATLAKLSQLAVQAFNRGGGVDQAKATIGDAALAVTLPPPVALLEQALHNATIEHRRIVRWRMRTEAMA